MSAPDLGLRLLGPVSCVLDGEEVDAGPPRQRAVLVMLAASPGRVVTQDQLVEGLWGGRPPASARQSVYTYVAGLRRAIEPARDPGARPGLLVGAAGGYRLLVEPDQVDAIAFTRLAEAARRSAGAGAHPEALRVYEQALGLWRGRALGDVPGPFAEAERLRLEELRAGAVEGRAAARIRLGAADEAVPELRALVARHPLREHPYELLVLALDACGRRQEALRVYEEARHVLDDELGVGPGEGLRRAYALVGGGTEVAREEGPVPRQLPRDLSGFVGRPREIARLRALLAPGDDEPPPMVVISGAPGSGKSALAVHVAHGVRHRFPDGQVFVNLRGGTPNVPRLTPQEIAARLLRAIGTPNEDVPPGSEEAVALWRARAQGRRLLVLLDDAAGLAQIRWLLPVPEGVCVLVTSRESLRVGDGRVRVRLGRLPRAEAGSMLAGLAGKGRVRSDPAGTASLIRLCDGLPLALRIAGARLADRPDWTVGELAGRLADERTRLHELEAGDLAVRSGLAASWSHLTHSDHAVDRAAARMLALLGLVHVPDLSADAAARLAGVPEREAGCALDRLSDAHLLERDVRGRFQLHDLVRVFAGELVPAEGRKAPLLRLFGYYAAGLRSAARTADPNRVHPTHLPVAEPGRAFRDADEANAWIEREEPTLLAAAAQAMADPDDDLARTGAALGLAMLWPQQKAYRVADLISIGNRALSVAERLADDETAMHAHSQAGVGEYFKGDLTAALEHIDRHLTLARRLNDRFEEQRAHGNLAATYAKAQRYDRALEHALAQREIAREISSEVGERYALLQIGNAHRQMGRLGEAAAALEEAAAMAGRAGDAALEGHMRHALGALQLDRGDLEAGLAQLERALGRAVAGGTKLMQVQCLIQLARANRLLTRRTAAAERLAEAESLARALDSASWLERVAEEREAMGAAGPEG
ncbi:BTAD domain-containing putative transcriptional regulator [Nonomuraea spiralis]|uniref:BTAD domain-containing putative transcriptional regulator n=1 Tax=Nonomuraea spiralis TaxID=46182 RepID=A0ABV5IYI3_9ACTN|nr:BTAD domain-containing putative transcriptional regulator [Nonomuraea spiralis]GGS88132.1 SARP family transcriptional regulator [Nonomuraea spiralis]